MGDTGWWLWLPGGGTRVRDVPVPAQGAPAWCHLPLQQQIGAGRSLRMWQSCGRAAGLFALLEVDVGSGNSQLVGTAPAFPWSLWRVLWDFPSHTWGKTLSVLSFEGQTTLGTSLPCPCTKWPQETIELCISLLEHGINKRGGRTEGRQDEWHSSLLRSLGFPPPSSLPCDFFKTPF